jgi:hypothetical protein
MRQEVIQYDLDGNEIARFETINAACKSINVSDAVMRAAMQHETELRGSKWQRGALVPATGKRPFKLSEEEQASIDWLLRRTLPKMIERYQADLDAAKKKRKRADINQRKALDREIKLLNEGIKYFQEKFNEKFGGNGK